VQFLDRLPKGQTGQEGQAVASKKDKDIEEPFLPEDDFASQDERDLT
jgi:hypothetical protein